MVRLLFSILLISFDFDSNHGFLSLLFLVLLCPHCAVCGFCAAVDCSEAAVLHSLSLGLHHLKSFTHRLSPGFQASVFFAKEL